MPVSPKEPEEGRSERQSRQKGQRRATVNATSGSSDTASPSLLFVGRSQLASRPRRAVVSSGSARSGGLQLLRAMSASTLEGGFQTS